MTRRKSNFRLPKREKPLPEPDYRPPRVVARRLDSFDQGYDIVRVEPGKLEKRAVGR